MSKILVTGGTGFLGRFIIDRLIREKFRIRALVRNPNHHTIKDWGNHVEVVKGDILDISSLDSAMEGITHVIHSAATVSFHKKEHQLMKLVNETGTANVVNLCLEKGVQRLVHVSSVSALGRTDKNEIMNENTKWQDSPLNTFYAKTKYLAEKQVYRGIEEGLNAVICSPSMIMGYGDWNLGTPKMFSMIYSGFPFYPVGKNGFVGAVDVAEAIRIFLDAPNVIGKKYILSQTNWTYKQLFDTIAFALNKPAPKWKIPKTLSLTYGSITEFFGEILNKPSLVTKETALTSSLDFQYDGSLVTKELGLVYTPLDIILKETAALFLQENVMNSK
jgi:nucleoside-diphosphate-sugar epimerase